MARLLRVLLLALVASLLVASCFADQNSQSNNNQNDNNDHRAPPPPPGAGYYGGNPDVQSPIPLVVDTDMGLDDLTAIGLLLAHSVEQTYVRSNSRKVHLLGMCTNDGITYVANGTNNLLRLLQRTGRAEVPVYGGEALVNTSDHIVKPFKTVWKDFMSALQGVYLPPQVDLPERESPAEFLIRISHEHPGFTLLSLGVLENIAQAMVLDPTFPSRVGLLVMMAGNVYVPGNARAGPGLPYVAEWNLFCDQWSAAKVINSGAFNGKFYLSPLDVTKFWFWQNASDAISAIPDEQLTPAGSWMKTIINYALANGYITAYDPTAAELLLRPDLMTLATLPIAVVPTGYNASAMYIADPATSHGFSWVRAALNHDVPKVMEWYACSVTGTCQQ